MNRIYRLVWNHRTQSLTAVAENARGHSRSGGRSMLVTAAIATALLAIGDAHAIDHSITDAQTTTLNMGNGDTVHVSPGGSITPTSGPGVNIARGITTGGISNSGSISTGREFGSIQAWGGNVDGNVINNGTLYGGVGVFMGGNTLTGSLTNSGSVYGMALGINLTASTLAGKLINSGVISGDRAGLYLSSSLIAGGLTNSGTISGNLNGISLTFSSTLTGGITNSGTIAGGSSNGIYLESSTLTGGLANSGTISADNNGIRLASSTLTNGLTNSGTISTNGNGIRLASSTLAGGLTNSGTISEGSNGIYLSYSTLTGDLTNSGTVSGSSNGLYLYRSTLTGGLSNSGIISTDTNQGIYLESSTFSGGLTNSGTIAGGTQGLKLNNSAINGDVISSGMISASRAGILLEDGSSISGALTNTGTIAGGIAGVVVASSDIVNGITNSGLIIGGHGIMTVKSIPDGGGIHNLAGGRIVGLSGYALHRNSSTDVITVSNDEGGTLVGGIVGHANVENNGLWALQLGRLDGDHIVAGSKAGKSDLKGDYTQGSTGVLRISASNTGDAGYSQLLVSGTATLPANARIDVDVAAGSVVDNVLAIGGTLNGVIQAGTLSASTFNVTDNSVLVSFKGQIDANEVDLVIGAEGPEGTGYVDSVGATRSTPSRGAASVLDDLQNRMIANGSSGNAAMDDVLLQVIEKHSASEAQVSAVVRQTLPVLLGASAQAGMTAQRSMNKVIQARIEGSAGLSAGENGAEQHLWVRGFGSQGDQSDRGVVTGFESKTAGFVVGGDAPLNDRLRVGAAFSYARSDIDGNSRVAPNSVEVDSYELIAYASDNIAPDTNVNYQFDIGHNQAQSSRGIGFIGSTAKGRFDSLAVHGGIGLGHTLNVGPDTSVTPSVRADYTHLRTEGYTETGAGPLNLKVDASTFEELMVSAEVKALHKLSPTTTLSGNGSIGYDLMNEQAQSAASFIGGGTSFVTYGIDPSPWVYRAGLGLSHDNPGGVELSVRYDVENRSSGYLNQMLSAKARWAF